MKKLILSLFILGTIGSLLFYSIYKSPGYKECMGGNLFVVNKLDHNISIIDLSQKTAIKTLEIGIEPHEVIISADKKYLIVSDFGNETNPASEIFLISTETFELLKTIHLKNKTKLHGLELSLDSNKILVTSEGASSLILLNIQTGEIESETKTLGKESHMVLRHPNKTIAYVANIGTNDVSVINYEKDSLVKNIYCGKGTEGLAITPNGNELWTCNKFEDSISIINTENLELIRKLKTGKMPVRLAISPDGSYCISSNHAEGNLYVFDTQSKEIVKKIELPGSSNLLDKLFNDSPTPSSLLFHPSKPFLFVINSNADRTVLLSTDTWKIIGSWKVGDIPDGIAINTQPDNCDF